MPDLATIRVNLDQARAGLALADPDAPAPLLARLKGRLARWEGELAAALAPPQVAPPPPPPRPADEIGCIVIRPVEPREQVSCGRCGEGVSGPLRWLQDPAVSPPFVLFIDDAAEARCPACLRASLGAQAAGGLGAVLSTLNAGRRHQFAAAEARREAVHQAALEAERQRRASERAERQRLEERAQERQRLEALYTGEDVAPEKKGFFSRFLGLGA
jgi:hypothetical protein